MELLGLVCSQPFLSSSSFFLLANRIILGRAKRSSSPPNISTSPLFPLNAQNRLSSERKGQRKSNNIMQRFQNIFNRFSASVHTILFDFQPSFFSGNSLDLTVQFFKISGKEKTYLHTSLMNPNKKLIFRFLSKRSIFFL